MATKSREGRPIALVPSSQEFSTVEAAHFLNVSRPFVVKEIDAGRLPHRLVGSHRRVAFEDLIAYARKMREQQESALERLAENAREISQLGRELYKRLADMGGHLAKLGQSLGISVRAYNSTVASLESRVLPSARRFKELDAAASQHELAELPQLDHLPRDLQSPELRCIG